MPRTEILRLHPSGAYAVACDGRHPFPHYVYYFYTKTEVRRLFEDEHPDTGDIDV